MRISDWSSDVCSSDLFAYLRGVRMVRAGEDTQIAHLLAAERTAGDHSLHRLFKDTLGETACQHLVGAGFLDAAGIAGVAIIDLLRQLLAGEPHLVRVDDDRSEEHTSELQSLMRISFAV